MLMTFIPQQRQNRYRLMCCKILYSVEMLVMYYGLRRNFITAVESRKSFTFMRHCVLTRLKKQQRSAEKVTLFYMHLNFH